MFSETGDGVVQFRWIAILVFCCVLASCGRSTDPDAVVTQESAPSAPKDLFKQANRLNAECRDGTGSLTGTRASCDKRDVLFAELKDKGWCQSVAPDSQNEWVLCSANIKANNAALDAKYTSTVNKLLLNYNLCESCSTDAAQHVIHKPNDKCGQLVSKVFANDAKAKSTLVNNFPAYCKWNYNLETKSSKYLRPPNKCRIDLPAGYTDREVKQLIISGSREFRSNDERIFGYYNEASEKNIDDAYNSAMEIFNQYGKNEITYNQKTDKSAVISGFQSDKRLTFYTRILDSNGVICEATAVIPVNDKNGQKIVTAINNTLRWDASLKREENSNQSTDGQSSGKIVSNDDATNKNKLPDNTPAQQPEKKPNQQTVSENKCDIDPPPGYKKEIIKTRKVYTSPDGKIYIDLFEMQNNQIKDLGTAYKSVKDLLYKGDKTYKITYERVRPDWIVSSGFTNDETSIFYTKLVKRDNVICRANVLFSADHKDGTRVATAISKTLRASPDLQSDSSNQTLNPEKTQVAANQPQTTDQVVPFKNRCIIDPPAGYSSGNVRTKKNYMSSDSQVSIDLSEVQNGKITNVGTAFNSLKSTLNADGTLKITYQTIKPNWIVVSGYINDGREIFYAKILQESDAVCLAQAVFPVDYKNGTGVATSISKTLRISNNP
jgi:hypothetical protein